MAGLSSSSANSEHISIFSWVLGVFGSVSADVLVDCTNSQIVDSGSELRAISAYQQKPCVCLPRRVYIARFATRYSKVQGYIMFHVGIKA